MLASPANLIRTNGTIQPTMPEALAVTIEYEEILAGLQSSEKSIPSKYFYDQRGGELFDAITELDEYYLTRAEHSIFDRYLSEISELLSSYSTLIEFGSGDSDKTLRILSHLPTLDTYIPVDISEQQLLSSSSRLSGLFPQLEIVPLCADFTADCSCHISSRVRGKVCVFFPGSTIGNYIYPEATQVLRQIAELVGPEGGLLVGVDLEKEASIVELAYNDRLGITARFNKNILAHLNDLFQSDFDLDAFSHRAIYNEQEERVEMYLVSTCNQTVHFPTDEIFLEEGEAIRTEYSYKYPLAAFRKISEEAGFETDRIWMDDQSLFSVHFLTVK